MPHVPKHIFAHPFPRYQDDTSQFSLLQARVYVQRVLSKRYSHQHYLRREMWVSPIIRPDE